MKKVFIKTFGCRTNIFDTQIMLSHLKDFTIAKQEAQADIIVINSCTVTNKADSSVRAYINHINRSLPKVKIFLTGCGVHTKGETLFKSEKLFAVFGQSKKRDINTILQSKEQFFKQGNLTFTDNNIVKDFIGKSRAFIKIQEGCSFRCNYCIIPYARGNSRNIDETIILKQINELTLNGFGEFILTGTNIGSYGSKIEGTSIAKLLKRISLIKGVKRIRLGSIESIQIDDEFKELLDEPWMAKHLHVALQHTSDDMLRIMNRRNRVTNDLALFEYLSNKGYALGTDFIVGHPGETEEIWSKAYKTFKNFPLTHIHVFCYSKRDGTPSAKMKKVIAGNVAKQRSKLLTSFVDKNNYTFRCKYKNEISEVLVECIKDDFFYGLDQYFNFVYIKSSNDIIGDLVKVKIDDIKQDGNYGHI